MKRLFCLLLGHQWLSYNVYFPAWVGWPRCPITHGWYNSRCARCGEFANPLIGYEQVRALREPGAYELGDWLKRRP